jgi:hypothetical protein
MMQSVEGVVKHNLQLMPAACSSLLAAVRQLHHTAYAAEKPTAHPGTDQLTPPLHAQ